MRDNRVLKDRRETDGGLTTADIAHEMDRRPEPEGNEHKEDTRAQLFRDDETRDFRSRWERIQISFVDQPREAVADADELVAAAIKRLAEIFADERAKLESEWDRGEQASTEDLRIALQRYRSFFDRILSV